MAWAGQLSIESWQLQLAQASDDLTKLLPSSPKAKTSGQVETHRPQPIHKFGSTVIFFESDMLLLNFEQSREISNLYS